MFEDILIYIIQNYQTYVFSSFYIISYVMVAFLKIPAKETWSDHFKRFLSFSENEFEDLYLLPLDGELSLWEHHWKNSVKGLPDNVNSTLKQKPFPSFSIIKRALRTLGQCLSHHVPFKSHLHQWSSLKIMSGLLRQIIALMPLRYYISTQIFTLVWKKFFRGSTWTS